MDLTYADGETTFTGYFVDGSQGRTVPGLLVLHGGAGLDQHARFQAERYADLGYAVFAADLYGEGAMASRETVLATIGRLREDRKLLSRRTAAALALLRSTANLAGRIGIVGFCFGGMAALEFARSGAAIDAVVSIHGSLTTQAPAEPGTIKAAVLACHGAADPHVPMEHVIAFGNEMTAAGVNWEIDIYGGAVHGFTHRDAVGSAARPDVSFDERADRLSFERVARFFEQALTPD